MKKFVFSLIVVSSTISGCSSLTQGEMQTVALTASYEGNPVDAECKLNNDRGAWSAKSPMNVAVRKSGEDLEVTCKKEGMPDGLLKAISRAAGSMFGNIIFGGGIGAVIDHTKGTGYNYPNQLPVKMGESVVIDRKNENTSQTAAAR